GPTAPPLQVDVVAFLHVARETFDVGRVHNNAPPFQDGSDSARIMYRNCSSSFMSFNAKSQRMSATDSPAASVLRRTSRIVLCLFATKSSLIAAPPLRS